MTVVSARMLHIATHLNFKLVSWAEYSAILLCQIGLRSLWTVQCQKAAVRTSDPRRKLPYLWRAAACGLSNLNRASFRITYVESSSRRTDKPM